MHKIQFLSNIKETLRKQQNFARISSINYRAKHTPVNKRKYGETKRWAGASQKKHKKKSSMVFMVFIIQSSI